MRVTKWFRNAAVGIHTALLRGVAVFFGAFGVMNVVLSMLDARLDAANWWFSFGVGGSAAVVCRLALSVPLLAFGIVDRPSTRLRLAVVGAATCIAVICFANARSFYAIRDSQLHASSTTPLSLWFGLAFVWLAAGAARRHIAPATVRKLPVAAFGAATAGVFALGQMVSFGATDYRRSADAVVVFGAGVYRDGSPSLALSDRVRTGCALMREGYAPRLILSGGPGPGAVHETEAMRSMALRLGVPARAITIDRRGRNTAATARNTAALLRPLRSPRILAVSHAYHLPRVHMSFQRQGVDAFTVPARESRTLRKMPLFMVREVAALWLYFAAPWRA